LRQQTSGSLGIIDGSISDPAPLVFHTGEFAVMHPGTYGEEDSFPVVFESSDIPDEIVHTQNQSLTTPGARSEVESPFVVVENYQTSMTRWRDYRRSTIPMFYGAKPTSGFVHQVGAFMTVPGIAGTDLVVKPVDPNVYCNAQYGPITRIPINSINPYGWTIWADITVQSELTTTIVATTGFNRFEHSLSQFVLSSGDRVDRIPSYTFDAIRSAITGGTGHASLDDIVSGPLNGMVFRNCDSIAAFPTITYSIYTLQGEIGIKTVDIVLFPEDYATIDLNERTCTAFIWESIHNSLGKIGSNLFGTVAVLFDYDEDIVGFCDPAAQE